MRDYVTLGTGPTVGDKPILKISEIPAGPLRGRDARDAGKDEPAPKPETHNPALDRIPIQQVEVAPETRIVAITDPRSAGADRLRYLRMRLLELRGLSRLRSLAITSALPGDGKSTIALNLAVTLSERGRRSVLLIEGDMHLPAVAKALNVPAQPGLAECLESDAEPLESIRRLEPLNIYLMQAGQPRSNPTELLQSTALAQLVDLFHANFDWILFDTPAIAPLTDALTVSRQVDGTLLVIRADQTDRDVVEDAISQIGAGRIAGIVFNGAEGLNRYYAKYAKYYGKK